MHKSDQLEVNEEQQEVLEKGIDKYANLQITMCTQYTGCTVHKQQCVHNT